MKKKYFSFGMTSTIDLGFFKYVPRLRKTLLSGLTKYFEQGHYDKAEGDLEAWGYADWIYAVNGLALFAFRRHRNDDGDLEDYFDIELQTYNSPQKIIWDGMYDVEKEGIYVEMKVVEEKIEVFVNTIVKAILKFLNNFNDVRKIPLCCSCGDLVAQEGKKFCWKCDEKCAYNSEICSICLDEEEKVSVWVKLDKCGHVFHSHCVSKLFEKDSGGLKPCPLCRKEFYHFSKTIL
jgi:hypothetical protein